MSTIQRFEDLTIWKLARELAKSIFLLTKYHDFSKDYRFVAQIRASSGSAMDNIAEGFDREGNKEFIQFLYISKGSTNEVKSQLYRALDCEYINKEEFELNYNKATELSNKTKSFINYLRQSELKGNKYKN